MLTFLTGLLNSAAGSFDERFEDTPPHQIVLATATVLFLWHQYTNITQAYRTRNNTTYKQRVIDVVYSLGKNLPQVKAYLDAELHAYPESVCNNGIIC